MLKRQRIKKEKRKWKHRKWTEFKNKTKRERQMDFFLNHPSSKFVANLSQKLRCQTTGCRETAVTLKGKKKVCVNCSKKRGEKETKRKP